MPPYEYRVCAVADPESECTWDVFVHMRDTYASGEPGPWRSVHTGRARGTFNGNRPAAYFKQILKALKV